MPRSPSLLHANIEAIREFNRFYVPRMGFLNSGWTTLLSLTEARTIHEVYIRASITSSEISRLTGIDEGYLSRILRKFERNGYITRKKLIADGRQRVVAMTSKGRRLYDDWSKIAQQNVADVISGMDDATQREMLDAMQRITALINAADQKKTKSP